MFNLVSHLLFSIRLIYPSFLRHFLPPMCAEERGKQGNRRRETERERERQTDRDRQTEKERARPRRA